MPRTTESDNRRDYQIMKHALIFLALVLVVIWVIARVVLTITSVALHALWVLAIILIIVWLVNRART
jgi:Ca2+/Na+ antiporter